ncbi:DUF4030 domain-containing protein [Priestia aryabhattai]|uniref:DUF4030 domain-containing protein n=1 Tax=Priestia megaterium TaxID=1404 RepID=UPI0039B9A19A
MKKPFNSYIDDNLLEKLNEELIWKPTRKQKHKQRLLETINQLESSQPVKSKSNLFSIKQNHLLRNVIYFVIAFFILSGAFISSAFVFPAMAQVVAKIPYLGQLFKQEPVSDVLYQELEKKGYKTASVGQTYYGGKKELIVSVEGSEKYFNKVRGDITDIATNILSKRQYDAYTFKTERMEPYVYTEPNAQEKKIEKIQTDISTQLKKHHYDFLVANISFSSPPRVEVEIPNTEKRVEEIKAVIHAVLAENKTENASIKIKKINLQKRDQDNRWGNIITDVGEDLLGKEKYHVKMVGYSVHPEPQVLIYTSLSISQDNKKFASELEEMINEFLETKEMKNKVKDDSYQVLIYGKGKKKLN